jgi:ParB family chromosome partitioning protein
MAKARGLGRGLSSLIPERTGGDGGNPTGGVEQIDVGRINPNPFPPRRRFSEEQLLELAESVRVHGVIQPVLVRPMGTDYQVIAGERRLRAAKQAGLSTIPAVIRELNDREAIELALVENLQRSDLNPMEESQAFQRLVEEFQWTQDEIGARVGKSRSHVANYLRLLQLEPAIQDWVAEQVLSVAHAKVLLSVESERRQALAGRCAREGWTVKQLEGAVKRGEVPAPSARRDDVHIKSVETSLRRRFGTKVTVRGDSTKGRIEFPYRSLDEFERLLALLEQEAGPGPEGFVV